MRFWLNLFPSLSILYIKIGRYLPFIFVLSISRMFSSAIFLVIFSEVVIVVPIALVGVIIVFEGVSWLVIPVTVLVIPPLFGGIGRGWSVIISFVIVIVIFVLVSLIFFFTRTLFGLYFGRLSLYCLLLHLQPRLKIHHLVPKSLNGLFWWFVTWRVHKIQLLEHLH